MAQIRQVVSESLQATIRRLLPSQQGFTEDLQATNVITPIIDLTPTAEGSSLPDYLQTSLAFDDVTAFDANNATVTVVNTAGFWRISGNMNASTVAGTSYEANFSLSDGLSTKKIYLFDTFETDAAGSYISVPFDFVVCLSAGDSLSATTNYARVSLTGNSRQIADLSGNLVNPSGFSAQ